MADISKTSGQVTYKHLNQALITLGFVCRETKDFTAYREAEHGAFIVLPRRSADSAVGDPHLVSVRNTVTGKGIVSVDELQALLVSAPLVSNYRKPGKREYARSKGSIKRHRTPTPTG